MRGNFSSCEVTSDEGWGFFRFRLRLGAPLIAGIYILAAAPAHSQFYAGPGPAPSGPQTSIWQNANGGSFAGNNWGATAYLYANGPQPPMPPDYQVGVYTGAHWGPFIFQAAPGAADTAIFTTLATGNSPSNFLPTIPGGIILCCSIPSATGYGYAEPAAGTKNYTVSLGGGTIAQLDAVSTGNATTGAAPILALSGAFNATNLAVLETTDGSTPVTVTDTGTLTTASLDVAGAVNVTDGTLKGNIVTIDAATPGYTPSAGTGKVSSATLTLTGEGSTLSSTSALYIGQTANDLATLDLEKDSSASTGNVYVGFGAATTTGKIIINAATMKTSNGFAAIGYNGTGALNISNGGSWTLNGAAGSLYISGVAGSTGTATVTGQGSALTAGGYIFVGQDGQGTLTVSNAASVTGSQGVYVSNDTGSNGTLNISSGGQVQAARDGGATAYAAIIGGSTGTNGTVTIGGNGSLMQVAESMRIGAAGTGTVMVQNGGKLEVDGATLEVGSLNGSNGTLTITGSGSGLTAPNTELDIGGAGNGSVTIQNGASNVSLGKLVLGNQPSGRGFLNVTGATTSAQFASAIIGNAGSGMAMVGAGASTTVAGTTQIGEGAGQYFGTLTVSGANTVFTSRGALTVADAGTGSLTVDTNAMLSAQDGLNIANKAGVTGTVTINNGTVTVNGDDVNIGNQGTGSVTLQGTGALQADNNDINMAIAAGSVGRLTVIGGSVNSTGLTVGGQGSGTLTIQMGSVTTSGDATVAESGGSTGNVELQGGSWSVGGDLTIGGESSGTVLAQAGLTVAGELSLGESAGANGQLTANGKGALKLSQVTIGEGGTGTLEVAKGANATATGAVTVAEHEGSGGLLNLSGGSFTADQTVTVGDEGDGSVTISAGGKLTDLDLITLGAQNGGTGTVTVTDGSNWLAEAGGLTIGDRGTGNATIQNGAALIADGVLALGAQQGGTGTLTVSGGTTATGGAAKHSSLAYASNLVIGDGGSGTLDVTDGGTVAPTAGPLAGSGAVEIAGLAGSDGVLAVSGSGSAFKATRVTVGGSATQPGGNGSVSVTGGGTIKIASALTVWGSGHIAIGSGSSIVLGSGAAISGKLAVTEGGTLSGTGTISGGISNKGGVVHVGDDPGVMTVDGDYVQGPDGTLQIEVGPSSTSLLDVTGTASLAGTLALQPVDGGVIRLGQSYDIVNATGGITGAFSTYDTGSPFLTLLPQLGGGALDFTVAHAQNSFAAVAQTANQAEVAGALDVSADTASGDFANGVDALSNARVVSVRSSFDSLSGEAYGDLATISLEQSRGFATAMMDRLNALADGAGDSVGVTMAGDNANLALRPGAPQPQTGSSGVADKRYSVWAEGTGNFANDAGGAYGSHGFNTTTAGMAAGVDAALAPNWQAGAAFSYGHSNLSASTLQSSATLDDYDVAFYSGATFGRLYLRGAAGYVSGNESLIRGLNIAGGLRQATGNPDSQQMFGALETGETMALPHGLSATPFARLDAARYWQNAVAESNANDYNLNVAGQTISSLQTTLGSAFGKTFLPDAATPLRLSASAGWAHEFAQTARPITAAFAGAPDQSFTVNAAPISRNSAVVSTSLIMLTGQTNIFVRYDGQYGALNEKSAITGGIVFLW